METDTGQQSISDSPYGYYPSQGVNFVFLIGFTSSLIGIITISLYTRRWIVFALPICVTCLFEAVGYAVRMGSWEDPWNAKLFVVTTFFLTTAPTFITTSIYLVMGETLFVLGQEHSLINPSWYNYCIGADVLSFAVQVMGLAFAIWDVAGTGSVGQESDTGGRIIAGGTVIHALMLVVVLVIYVVALLKGYISWCETGYTTFNIERGGYKKCSTRFKVFLAAITVALLCLLARDVNRMIGFIQEFDGGNRNQARWAALDGLLVSEAVLGLVVLHPSYVFSDYNKKKKYSDGVRTPSSASYGRLARQVIV